VVRGDLRAAGLDDSILGKGYSLGEGIAGQTAIVCVWASHSVSGGSGAYCYSTFAHRFAIEAKVWYWKHGYATRIGSYEIPVPDDWVILDRDSKSLIMANTSPTPPPDDDKYHTTAVVTVDVDFWKDVGWTDRWISFERRGLANRKVEAATEKTLKLGEESITCIGGKELKAALKDAAKVPRIEAMSLSCRSDRGFSVLFVGEPTDVEAFYSLLSQVRRTS
jgi:hypothetical protein